MVNEIKRLLVIAGNRAQFNEWCRLRKISPADRRLVFVSREFHLRGIVMNLPYLVVGWPGGAGNVAQLSLVLYRRQAVRVSETDVDAWLASVTPGGAP